MTSFLNLTHNVNQLLQQREEIYLDYGQGWEEAWETYRNTWTPPEENGPFASYSPIKELNDKREPPRSISELIKDPFQDNVMTGCMYSANYDYQYDAFEAGFNWTTLSDEMILQHFSGDGSNFIWEEIHSYPQFWPCSIITGNDRDGFTVRIFQASWEGDTPWTEKGLPMIFTKYSRESIRYFNKQGRSDQFLPNSFRHHPELADDIFPDQWKNLL